MVEQAFPNYSYGEDVNNPGNMVFKVDEGKYQGTVFNFADVALDENQNLKYTVNFQLLLKNMLVYDTISQDEAKEFYDEVATLILLDVISQTKEVAQTQADKQIIT